jgi:hypothetical protein
MAWCEEGTEYDVLTYDRQTDTCGPGECSGEISMVHYPNAVFVSLGRAREINF